MNDGHGSNVRRDLAALRAIEERPEPSGGGLEHPSGFERSGAFEDGCADQFGGVYP